MLVQNYMIKPEQGRCAMEQECRYLSCKKCDTTHIIEVSEEQIGQVIDAICPTCGMTCQTIPWKRPSMEGLIDKLVLAAWNDVIEGSYAQPLIETIKQAGFIARLRIDVEIEPIPLEQLPEPMVVDGVVNQTVYTEEDEKYLREMQIAFKEEN